MRGSIIGAPCGECETPSSAAQAVTGGCTGDERGMYIILYYIIFQSQVAFPSPYITVTYFPLSQCVRLQGFMSTFYLEGVSTNDENVADATPAFLHPESETPARPGHPQRNVTLRDLNVEQNPALWRTILEIQDANVAEVPQGPTGTAREGRAGDSRDASDTHSHSTNSNSNLSIHGGSTAPGTLRSSSSDLRRRGIRAQLDAVLFGTDGAYAAAETSRRRGYIDRAFEAAKKGGGVGRRVGAEPPRTMQLSSRPAASKKLDEAMEGAAGVMGCALSRG